MSITGKNVHVLVIDELGQPEPPMKDRIEQEIVSKGLTAPRVTPADIQAEILSEHYFTAEHGVNGASAAVQLVCRTYDMDTINDKRVAWTTNPLMLLTFCVLVLRNGFTVTGESACASPENFNAEIGRKIARQKAEEKIWPLLGFRLRDKIVERDTVRYRCAETGEYVTQGYAEANPATTVRETD